MLQNPMIDSQLALGRGVGCDSANCSRCKAWCMCRGRRERWGRWSRSIVGVRNLKKIREERSEGGKNTMYQLFPSILGEFSFLMQRVSATTLISFLLARDLQQIQSWISYRNPLILWRIGRYVSVPNETSNHDSVGPHYFCIHWEHNSFLLACLFFYCQLFVIVKGEP